MIATFETWTANRPVHSLSTNWRAKSLPFQDWRRFKEAFAPELVARAVRESRVDVRTCIDPFGGSGTTALACQFLGVHPTTIEVNPYLADLIAAKLCRYDADLLLNDLMDVIRRTHARGRHKLVSEMPDTFVEPGVKGRWIFDRAVWNRIVGLREAIEGVRSRKHRRLFRVLLGGILIELSNVITSGKGRRYRKQWKLRPCDPLSITNRFAEVAESAIVELYQYSERECLTYDVLNGDARASLRGIGRKDISIFSPPYPNSFDYTDVYNVELWGLGYLKYKRDNRRLRESTLSSHVQIKRQFARAPRTSPLLSRTLRKLDAQKADLWNRHIPDMVGSYFAEMEMILRQLKTAIVRHGMVWMVVGDSQYADIPIPVSRILRELATAQGWIFEFIEPFRSMRASAQQGGRYNLTEDLVVLSKA
jgi:hypothetical protein